MRKDLLSMGYREISQGKWAKPIGYSIMTFEEKSLRWCSIFKSAFGEGLAIWTSKTFGEYEPSLTNFISWLKYVEHYHHREVLNPSEFEFLTIGQELDI